MGSRPGLAVHSALARGVFSVAVLVSLAVLFAPASDVPSGFDGADKIVHLLLFGVLASTGRWAGISAKVLAPLLVGYAAVSELVQGLEVLGRSMSVGDLVADVVGVLVGLVVWEAVRRRATTGS